MIIGLDVGGTHTDAVLFNDTKIQKKVKITTDPNNLFSTILFTLDSLLDGINTREIKRLVISTTLTTNAIVQKKIAPVAMIVISGPGIDPSFFRTGKHYYCASGSINHRGEEKATLDMAQINNIIQKIKKDKVEYLGITGKFSVRNPVHEILIKKKFKNDFKKIFLGHHVSGNLNFPRRIATTYLNASVFSIHESFFEAVKKSLEQKNIFVPIKILKADGGTMTLKASMSFPAQTILSGPAASIIGAIPYSPLNEDVLVFDIGGTTTDIACLVNKAPLLEPEGIKIGKYKSLIRSLLTRSEGIGGDSHVQVISKELCIGPHRKGPAMAFGGNAATVTDAIIVLGLMNKGDSKKAYIAIKSIADKLGIDPKKAADKILDKCCFLILKKAFEMIDHLNSKPVYTVHEFLKGYKISPDRILLLGGGARYFEKRIKDLYHIQTTTIPEASIANAIGAALARTTCEVILNADTQQGIVSSYEEAFIEKTPSIYSKQDLLSTAFHLLKKKAVSSGDEKEIDDIEVVEMQEFNVVRNFCSQGKLLRTKVQIKPGIIKRFKNVEISS